jgi:hypothetical protein
MLVPGGPPTRGGGGMPQRITISSASWLEVAWGYRSPRPNEVAEGTPSLTWQGQCHPSGVVIFTTPIRMEVAGVVSDTTGVTPSFTPYSLSQDRPLANLASLLFFRKVTWG